MTDIPDLLNLNISVFDWIFCNLNITNIKINALAANANRFFVRFEETYNLIEFTFDDIDFNITFDYFLYFMPPILVDQGSVEISSNDASLDIIG